MKEARGQLHTPDVLDKRLSVSYSWSGSCGIENNLLCLTGIELVSAVVENSNQTSTLVDDESPFKTHN